MKDNITLRIAMANLCVEMFKEHLNPGDWAQCVDGTDDPDSFCDSNMIVAEAYEETFGYDPAPLLGTDREGEVASNWNAAVRFASRLMVGETPNEGESAEIVTEDNPIGLQIVGGGRRLQEVVRGYGLTP